MLLRRIMYLLFIITIQLKHVIAADRIVKYTIGYDQISRCSPINICFKGSSDGVTSFYKPKSIWGVDVSSQLIDIKLTNSQQSFRINPLNSIPEIIHKPNEEINLNYKLCAYKGADDSYNRPYISNTISYFIGSMGLIIPQFEQQDNYLLRYDYKLPDTAKIYNSVAEFSTLR